MSSTTVRTNNADNLFEVSWKEDSNWFTKLFRIKTEFTFVTEDLGIDWKNSNTYLNLNWYDAKGRKVSASDRIDINIKLMLISINEIQSGWE